MGSSWLLDTAMAIHGCFDVHTDIFKFRVSFRVAIGFRVKLDYIRLDSIKLKVLWTSLTSGMHLYVEG